MSALQLSAHLVDVATLGSVFSIGSSVKIGPSP